MDISLILQFRFRGSEWSLSSDDYDGLVWFSDSVKPSLEELEALWPGVEYEIGCLRVENERQIAYRETSDPIFFEYQRGDKTEAEWLAAVQAVKDANPYPVAV